MDSVDRVRDIMCLSARDMPWEWKYHRESKGRGDGDKGRVERIKAIALTVRG